MHLDELDNGIVNTQYNVMVDCHLHNDGTLNTISKGPAFTATMYNMYIDKTKKTAAKEENFMYAPG